MFWSVNVVKHGYCFWLVTCGNQHKLMKSGDCAWGFHVTHSWWILTTTLGFNELTRHFIWQFEMGVDFTSIWLFSIQAKVRYILEVGHPGITCEHRSVTPKFVTPTAPSCIDNSWRSTTLPGADSASSNQTLPSQNEHEWVLEKLR